MNSFTILAGTRNDQSEGSRRAPRCAPGRAPPRAPPRAPSHGPRRIRPSGDAVALSLRRRARGCGRSRKWGWRAGRWRACRGSAFTSCSAQARERGSRRGRISRSMAFWHSGGLGVAGAGPRRRGRRSFRAPRRPCRPDAHHILGAPARDGRLGWRAALRARPRHAAAEPGGGPDAGSDQPRATAEILVA